VPTAGEVEFGGRLTSVAGDAGRFQRFRDLRSGPTVDRFRYALDRGTWLASAEADKVGYRDQRFLAAVERYGRVKASFEWNQVPLFHGSSFSPYRAQDDGVLRLDDTLQAAVQARTATVSAFGSELARIDTRSRRDTADLKLIYNLMRDVDLRVALKSTARTGEQPWGASFGFSNAIQLAAPLAHRTNDLTTAAEWSNRRGMVRIAYDGSWFNNDVETLTWDNPLRATDQTHASAYSSGDGSAQGRMAIWPDSTAHTVSASGSVALPARSRAFAHVSVGSWLQNQALLPHTINSAIAPIPLARQTAQAEARITSMTYRLTSRPTRFVWLTGQFRLYDYDNRTPHFPVNQYVRLDGNVGASVTGGSEPFAYTRRFADVDASFTPFRFVAFRAGAGQEHDKRSYRVFEETTERTLRASIDGTSFPWGSVRLQYDHAVRTGDGLDEQVLSDIGEQVSLRQFDISNRTRDRVSAILQVLPTDVLGLNVSLAIGQENRPEAAFGLQDNDLHAVTLGVDFTPTDAVTASLSYGLERYGTRQQSRQANPGVQFNDPTRDWWTDLDEDVHTVAATVELPRIAPRTSLAGGYDYVGSRAVYAYSLRPVTTLVAPLPLAPVRNIMHTARIDLRHTVTRRLSVGAGYRLDRYDVEDFALSPGTLNSPLIPTFVNLMGQWRPYDAHSGSLRLIYFW
jgi:MtrB/PioB family decaheme-associated outer membrane protein